MVLRNPVESTFSMFSMMYRDRRENCDSFAEAFHRRHERLAAGWEWAWNYRRLFIYSEQVARYLNLFPRSQFFIRRYEELKCTPEKFYRDLMEFMGVDYLKPRHRQSLGQYVGAPLAHFAAHAQRKNSAGICPRRAQNSSTQHL